MANDSGVQISTEDSGLEIAALLVKAGHLTPEQLQHAKRVKGKLLTPKTLVSVMLDLGFFNREQLRTTLQQGIHSVKLGALLVELGYLKPGELQAALAIQQEGENTKLLGEILVEQRFIEEYTLAEALAYQLGYPYLDIDVATIDRALLGRIPPQWIAQHSFLPIREEAGRVLVALADPLDAEARKISEKLFGIGTTFAIATLKGIREAVTLLKKGTATGGDSTATDEHTVTGIVNSIFEEAMREGASDIHIEPLKGKLRVRFRRDGILTLYKDFPKELSMPISSRVKVMADADIAERRRHQDGRICYESAKSGQILDMRVSFYITIHGEKIVLRLLNKKGELLELKEIGMPDRMLERFIDDALDPPSGVMIVTGPTGSGKTSTLYSCVQHLNTLDACIVTVEEPVEYIVEGIAQCSINSKIGVTFDETLRHIVRQDPDIIVLGEIRDNFSAETAIQAALTGHKVLTTFHTEDAVGGLLRLLNMNIEAFLIASTVNCVLAQRLLRRICSACAEPVLPTPTELRRISYSHEDLRGAEFKKGRGCAKCRYSGYRGRVGVFEMLILNELVKDAILSKKTSYEIRRISTETTGMVTLLESGLAKAAQGMVSLQDCVRLLPRIGRPRPVAEIRRLLGE
ncbi:GspE/PulE family protein [Geomesophilobacter sediminis]|uniref:Flp pilus assembly complex ATPase component TadA n=1 Tax=Geomesophilobacter sediminis TaxID=2798584 RepID=A0A8J7M298_9BACT|nr:GspE/PulE family protein [Geomesophilobacter sediminis]MBJ6726993.1 Flp pilus assembly complex ATPase component TadA [Geomesophilobacter sediminis]